MFANISIRLLLLFNRDRIFAQSLGSSIFELFDEYVFATHGCHVMIGFRH